MNNLLKYFGYLVVFIIVVFILLNILDKMGVGCLYDCHIYNDMSGKTIVHKDGKTYINNKEVKGL